MENKNVVIALVLMLAVWVGFTLLNPPSPPPQTPAPVSEPASSPAPATAPAVAAAAPLPVAGAERTLTVETETFTAVFTTAGARLQSLQLKDYRTGADAGTPPVSLVAAATTRDATLRTSGTGDLGLGADAPYALELPADSLRLAAGEKREIVFAAPLPSGAVVEKVFTFYGERYDFDLQVRVVNRSETPLQGSLTLALVRPWDEAEDASRFDFVGPSTLAADKVHTDEVEDLAKEPSTYSKDVVWTGFETKYFMTAAVPLQAAAESVRVEKRGEAVENLIQTPSRTLPPGEAAEFAFRLYFGPKDLEVLKQVDHQLARAIDFGFFTLIALPLLHVLKFFYGFLNNYGLAIILLTVIIKGLFWPLTQKSYSSMKAMQKLQPEMQRIREKYRNDRDRLNREIMELYRTNRVNPLGGCLPMLVQIPVFFALYKVLMVAIELRHAPFAFWITDLSAKDPYYVTPIIMGATMFIQQKMTPSTMDPMQAKVFLAMPVVFTFLFLNFPSGLVIYWLVNNLLTILQQFFINRKTS